MRTVSFIHSFGESAASYRYRARIPAEQIGAKINDFTADVLVFSKPQINDIEAARRAKKLGQMVVVDYCDDHFYHKTLGPIYREMADIADWAVVPTREMRKRVPSASVIPDPYEYPEVSPHADGDRFLWFGHQVNLPAIVPYKNLPNLTIVTGPGYLNTVEYSYEALKVEMIGANIALFPKIKGDDYKSPNRVVNALRMGLFPICDRHPAYLEFRRFLWASDVPTGLRWAKEFRHELNEHVKGGQDYIRDRFSPEAIGNQWRNLLEGV
jgi:hypothetical protein